MIFADFWRIISSISDFQTWIAIFLVILLGYFMSPKSKKHKLAWLVFVLLPAIVISAAFVELLKISTQIPRPCVGIADCPSGYSFPSGHAARIFTLAAVIALSIKDLRIKFTFLILAILVSISRVAVNYHTYADIIAGALIGIMIAYFVNLFYKRVSSLKTFKTIISS